MSKRKILTAIIVLSIFVNVYRNGICQLADSPWPKFCGNLQNSGCSSNIGPQRADTIWCFNAKAAIRSSPAIGSDGTIYVGAMDHACCLYAINPDGTEKWHRRLNAAVISSPAVDKSGTIYVGEWNKRLYALNSDGSIKWTFETGRDIKSSPSIGSDGTIYFGSADKKFYAVNPDSTLKWFYETYDWITYSSPAIDSSGTIYNCSWDGNLYAFNPEGPPPKWTYPSGGNIAASPAIGHDGTIYINAIRTESELHAVAKDGTCEWTYMIPGGSTDPVPSPAIGPDGTIYIGSYNGLLYALSSDGTFKWQVQTGGGILSSPAIGADGKIYFGSNDGFIYALKPDSSLKWKYPTKAPVRSSPAIGNDGRLYIGSDDGMLYALKNIPPIINIGEEVCDLDEDDAYWEIYPENSPQWIKEWTTKPSIDGKSLKCGITGGKSYSNVHCYLNLNSVPEANFFKLCLEFWFDETTYNNKDGVSTIQALEFTMNKWYHNKRYEWALQWQNVNVGQGAPQWRYWDPHQSESEKWVSLGINDFLEGERWHSLIIKGEITDADQVHYLEFMIDGVLHKIDTLYIEPAPVEDEPDRLAIAFQLDGTEAMKPYNVYVDSICFRVEERMPTHSEKDSQSRPQNFSLFQNMPNPFNTFTRIQYELSRSAEVILQVYDVMGRLINTLVHTQKTSGAYQVIWDGKDGNGNSVASGIYFCRLQVKDGINHRLNGKFIRKMLLIR